MALPIFLVLFLLPSRIKSVSNMDNFLNSHPMNNIHWGRIYDNTERRIYRQKRETGTSVDQNEFRSHSHTAELL